MRYIADENLMTIQLPPEEGTGEAGWVRARELRAGDYAEADRICRRRGVDVKSMDGVILLLARVIKEWSLPLPVEPGKLTGSLHRLSIDLVNFLAREIGGDHNLTEDQAQDLDDGPSAPSAETPAPDLTDSTPSLS